MSQTHEKYNYKYTFVAHGVTARQVSGKEIWLDVGNKMERGVFDHHTQNDRTDKKQNFKSTVDILTSKEGLALLRETKADFKEGDSICIYTHRNPDMDAIVSVFLVKEYLERGEEEYCKRYCSESTEVTAQYQCLVDYTNSIDEGKNKEIFKVDENGKEVLAINLYTLLCCLDVVYREQNPDIKEEGNMSNDMIAWGMMLIRDFLELVDLNPDKKVPYELEFTKTSIPGYFEAAKRFIAIEPVEAFDEEYRKGNVRFKNLHMWKKDDTVQEKVLAAVWRERPKSSFSYLHARKEGAVLTFVPRADYKGGIISLDVDQTDEVQKEMVRSLSLLPIADMLERLEQIREKKVLGFASEKTRSYGKPRGGLSKFDELKPENVIFHEAPFSETVNPWYIHHVVGAECGESDDIVDAPYGGTRLSTDEIINIIENITCAVEASFQITFQKGADDKNKSSGQVTGYAKESLYSWNKRTTEWLSQGVASTYKVAVVQISPEVIAHGYELLDSYYMTVNGGSYLQNDNMKVLRLDYRTHLYVNENNAVLFYTKNSNLFMHKTTEQVSREMAKTCDNCENDLRMKMMNAVTIRDESVAKKEIPDINIISDVVKVIYNLVQDRTTLNNIGKQLEQSKKFHTRSKSRITECNEELIHLIAKMQSDECSFDTKVKSDVHHFVKEVLEISELKDTMVTTVNLVLEDYKEKMYSFLSFIGKVAIPVGLVAEFIDLKFLSLKEGLELLDIHAGLAMIIITFMVLGLGFLSRGGRRMVKRYLESLNEMDEK